MDETRHTKPYAQEGWKCYLKQTSSQKVLPEIEIFPKDKWAINQTDIMVIDVQVFNNKTSKDKKLKLTEIKRQVDKFIILIGSFNNSVQKSP